MTRHKIFMYGTIYISHADSFRNLSQVLLNELLMDLCDIRISTLASSYYYRNRIIAPIIRMKNLVHNSLLRSSNETQISYNNLTLLELLCA